MPGTAHWTGREVEYDCPVCGSVVLVKETDKTWFGRCTKCRTRFYTDRALMSFYLKEAVNAGTSVES